MELADMRKRYETAEGSNSAVAVRSVAIRDLVKLVPDLYQIAKREGPKKPAKVHDEVLRMMGVLLREAHDFTAILQCGGSLPGLAVRDFDRQIGYVMDLLEGRAQPPRIPIRMDKAMTASAPQWRIDAAERERELTLLRMEGGVR